jgi:putative transposase
MCGCCSYSENPSNRFKVKRNMMRRGQLIFFTSTILYWKHLLKEDGYKQIILNSLRFLSDQKQVKVYGLVIMPNHIHLLWEIQDTVPEEKNIQHSFMSFTGHQFKKRLLQEETNNLQKFKVNGADRTYQFWERNPLAVEVYSKEVAEQKLDYLHLNPLQEKWSLAVDPEQYAYSSARFYSTGEDSFGFLNHYLEYFGR